jgi:RNA polymerase sigma-70 factor (ECF subfamily)
MARLPAPDPFLTRKSLLLRLKEDGEPRELAWDEFYAQYAPIIECFARKMGAKPQDTADLVQEVAMGFFSVSPKFVYDTSRGRFRGYLKTCTWRIFRDKFGRRLHVAGRPLEDVNPSALQVDDTWNDVWENEMLQRALGMVRQRYLSRSDKANTFRAFEMYALLDRSAEEVAAKLAMTIDSVHQAKSRVSKAIKAALDELKDAAG